MFTSVPGDRPSPSDEDIVPVFKINETAHWIRTNSFQQIGLQFPDNLLHVAAKVCHQLTELTGNFCFILADSSYADCCVDEVAGKRLHIDALVHYGHACLSSLSGKLPVFFVFVQRSPVHGSTSAGVQPVAETLYNRLLVSDIRQPLVITYDFDYQSVAYTLLLQLKTIVQQHPDAASWPIIWSEPNIPSHGESSDVSPFGAGLPTVSFKRCGRTFHYVNGTSDSAKPPWGLIHVGRSRSQENCEGTPFYRILLAFPEVDFAHTYYYNTCSREVDASETDVRTLLKRRTYLIEKAKCAQCVGILIGTLSVRDYHNVVERLQRLLRRAGRICITLVVGRLNPEKLANLPELDVLTIVGCPECSLLVSHKLLIPVITPFELECALADVTSSPSSIDNTMQRRSWIGDKLWIDFSDLLPGGAAYCPEDEVVPPVASQSDTSPDVSLVTGRLRYFNMTEDHIEAVPSDGAIITRGEWAILDSKSSATNLSRTWYGLDPSLGQTPIAQLQVGLSGVPTNYSLATETSTTNP